MKAKPLEQFTELSMLLTGFSKVELDGTGLVKTYYDVVHRSIGEKALLDLLALAGRIANEDEVRVQIIANPKCGPIARNIVKMWYLGSWNGVVISADAYKEGLLWPAIGTHPPGAKQPGYGSWSLPPRGRRS